MHYIKWLKCNGCIDVQEESQNIDYFLNFGIAPQMPKSWKKSLPVLVQNERENDGHGVNEFFTFSKK